jgi:hypothetical protein
MTPLQTQTAKSIIRKIEYHVFKNSTAWIVWSNWYIGITNKPHRRKSQHIVDLKGKPFFWVEYNARSRDIAESIEKRFHDKGMRDARHAGGARNDSKFVYVYKKYPTIFD